MPHFYDPSGRTCTADQAKSGGRLRPGFREVLADGENASMNIMMMDGMPKVVSSQTVANDAAVRIAVERERMIHDQRFAFLGDKAPPFDQARAEFLAQQRAPADAARAVRDAALAARYEPSLTGDRSEVDAAHREMIADLTGASSDNAHARDLIRAARYAN